MIVGVVLGGCINMAIILLGPSLIPPPAGVDVSDADAFARSIHLFEPKHFVVPFTAHALGTFGGALIACLIVSSHRMVVTGLVGLTSLTGGVAAALMIPAPAWFIVLDLAAAYLPMAWLAKRLGDRIRPPAQP